MYVLLSDILFVMVDWISKDICVPAAFQYLSEWQVWLGLPYSVQIGLIYSMNNFILQPPLNTLSVLL